MICDFNGCQAEATVAMRMGDGTFTVGEQTHRHRQTFVRYCSPCAVAVRSWFVTCDERQLDELLLTVAGGGVTLRR